MQTGFCDRLCTAYRFVFFISLGSVTNHRWPYWNGKMGTVDSSNKFIEPIGWQNMDFISATHWCNEEMCCTLWKGFQNVSQMKTIYFVCLKEAHWLQWKTIKRVQINKRFASTTQHAHIEGNGSQRTVISNQFTGCWYIGSILSIERTSVQFISLFVNTHRVRGRESFYSTHSRLLWQHIHFTETQL